MPLNKNQLFEVEARTARKPADKRSGKKAAPYGRKGTETRRQLMDATRKLLAVASPLSISAVAISREANTSPATFYVYFNDVEDILWALCDMITEDTSNLFAGPDYLRNPSTMDEEALEFVRGYCEIWAHHGPLLLYRNMEADRGNRRFYQLVLRVGLPILEGLTNRIVEAAAPTNSISRRDANAEAVVFVAAIDRIAAALHTWPEDSLMPDVLLRAEARVLVRMLQR
ncbi:MAG: TetR/AcrR family transcriptional regulator [Novosphingobium sp.]